MLANFRLHLLRLFLLAAGLGWGATVIGVVLPWNVAVNHLQTFGGAGEIPYDPMFDYWLRMASGAFGIIGIVFLLCAWKPMHFKNLIPILGVLNLGEGILLLVVGLVLKLAWFPFVVDVAIGVVPGVGIILLRGVLNDNRNKDT